MNSLDLNFLDINDLLSDIKVSLEIYDTSHDSKFLAWIYPRVMRLAKRGSLYPFSSPPIAFTNNRISLPANFRELGRFEVEVGGVCQLIMLRGDQSIFAKGCCNSSLSSDGYPRGMIRNGFIELDSNVVTDNIAHINYLGTNVDSNGYPVLFESYREPLRYFVMREHFALKGDSYKVSFFSREYTKRVDQLRAELNKKSMQELAEIGFTYRRIIKY